ncbi:MAG: cytochrome c oxidase subunit II [Pseudomonadota bacterium]
MRRILAFLTGLSAVGAGASAYAQQPREWQINLQTPATPFAEAGLAFNNLLLVIIIGISVFVLALLAIVIFRFNAKKNPTPSKTTHNTLLEVVWTVVPVLILVVIAVPSFRLLYLGDRVENPEMTLEVTGYQWYWGYEYPDQQIDEFSSYMIPDEDIDEEAGQLRLLSVDNPVVLPVDTDIQILVTAADVLHSFAVPAFMIKTDAVTMRWNETWARIQEEGVYYGQCSELCGIGHGFMPIEIRAVSREAFDQWTIDQVGDAEIDPENPPVLLTTTWAEAMAERDAQVRLATVE